jgi:hypothetical protein
MDAMTSQPWEQQPGESGPAYRAFCAFRDMGPHRSAVKAYGQSKGNEGATQKPGRWNVWAREHRWTERARAYDRHVEAIRLHEADEAAAELAHLWAARGEEQLERDWQAAEALRRRVEILLELPVVDVTAEADGQTTVIKAIRIRDLQALVGVTMLASKLAWSAIDAAAEMYGPDMDFDPATATKEELEAMIALIERGRRRPARRDAGEHSLARPS